MNTRKDNNGKALKAWVKTSPGHIAKPLRYIGSQTNLTVNGQVVPSTQFIEASRAARAGDGLRVQQMARSLA